VHASPGGNWGCICTLKCLNSLCLILEPDSVHCRRIGLETWEDKAEFVCEVSYTGRIQPTIRWLLKNNGEANKGTCRTHAVDGTLQSVWTVSADSPASWPAKCQITFPRQSCNEPRSAYTRTEECPSHHSSKYICIRLFISRYYIFFCFSWFLMVTLVSLCNSFFTFISFYFLVVIAMCMFVCLSICCR